MPRWPRWTSVVSRFVPPASGIGIHVWYIKCIYRFKFKHGVCRESRMVDKRMCRRWVRSTLCLHKQKSWTLVSLLLIFLIFLIQECDEGKSFLVIGIPSIFVLGIFFYISRGNIEKALSQRNLKKSEIRERLGLFAEKIQTKCEILCGLMWHLFYGNVQSFFQIVILR